MKLPRLCSIEDFDEGLECFSPTIVGNHNVSKPYLPFYLAEFTFWHNYQFHRDMFGELLSRCEPTLDAAKIVSYRNLSIGKQKKL
jgi:hypothetical protein